MFDWKLQQKLILNIHFTAGYSTNEFVLVNVRCEVDQTSTDSKLCSEFICLKSQRYDCWNSIKIICFFRVNIVWIIQKDGNFEFKNTIRDFQKKIKWKSKWKFISAVHLLDFKAQVSTEVGCNRFIPINGYAKVILNIFKIEFLDIHLNSKIGQIN